jgi:dolichol kinase
MGQINQIFFSRLKSTVTLPGLSPTETSWNFYKNDNLFVCVYSWINFFLIRNSIWTGDLRCQRFPRFNTNFVRFNNFLLYFDFALIHFLSQDHPRYLSKLSNKMIHPFSIFFFWLSTFPLCTVNHHIHRQINIHLSFWSFLLQRHYK